MNIYEKMLKATEEIGVVAKNLNIEAGRGKSYKAVSERDIIDAVKPIEVKYGIYSYPVARELVESEKLESEGYDGKIKTTFYTKLKTVYRFVDIAKPEDYIDITSYAVGMDSGDKGDGKAMTYADKYALMKAYKISTGDDPDKEPSPEERYKKKGKSEKTEVPPFPEDSGHDPSGDPVSESHVTALFKSCDEHGVPLQKVLDAYGLKTAAEMNMGQWNNAMNRLRATK